LPHPAVLSLSATGSISETLLLSHSVLSLSAAGSISETLLLSHSILSAEARLTTSLAALPRPALSAVAVLPGARTVSQTLLLHDTVLATETGLHLAITVPHHLPLHGTSLSAVAVLAGPAAPHSLLAAAATSPASAASGHRIPGNQTEHHERSQTNSNQPFHRTNLLLLSHDTWKPSLSNEPLYIRATLNRMLDQCLRYVPHRISPLQRESDAEL
jgi:hypothetical protein